MTWRQGHPTTEGYYWLEGCTLGGPSIAGIHYVPVSAFDTGAFYIEGVGTVGLDCIVSYSGPIEKPPRVEKSPVQFAEPAFEIVDTHGRLCSLQKSSADDCVWLGINELKPMIRLKHGGELARWVPFDVPPDVFMGARMHLSRSHVREILPYLQRFAETGDVE